MSFEITSVQFGETGMAISYLDVPTDVRDDGDLMIHRTLQVSGKDHADDIAALHSRIERALRDKLEDFAEATPVDPDEPRELDEEDELGMGMGT